MALCYFIRTCEQVAWIERSEIRGWHKPHSFPPMIALTKRAAGSLTDGIDGLSQESEQGMRCGTKVPMPQLPPQL
jgi:hypothetical protein